VAACPVCHCRSLAGGYATWNLGRKVGDSGLRRYVPALLLRRVTGWVEQHRILAVFLPAVLPPPIPLLPFALAAGALGVSRSRYMLIYGAARTLRYSLIAWLVRSMPLTNVRCIKQQIGQAKLPRSLSPKAQTTNIAMPAANMAIVVIATTIHPRRELGWPCISFLSAATIRIATMRNGASNPLITAVQ